MQGYNPEEHHPSIQQVMKYFKYDHLPPNLQMISEPCCVLAVTLINTIRDSPGSLPELTVGLRKLLEAKDCFVRAELG